MADTPSAQRPKEPAKPTMEKIPFFGVLRAAIKIIFPILCVIFIFVLTDKNNASYFSMIIPTIILSSLYTIALVSFILLAIFLYKYISILIKKRSYVANYAKYQREYAAWATEQQRRLREQEEKERRAAEILERDRLQKLQLDAARRAYAEALQARQITAARFYEAFNAAYQNTKYEAALHGVTSPEEVLVLFVGGFPYLPISKHVDAGLLREKGDDPHVAAILHMLPPLRPMPKNPG